MLKLSLVVMFVLSLATLSFASSLMPTPATAGTNLDAPLAIDQVQPHVWIETFE